MDIEKASAYYSLLVGTSIVLIWLIILVGGGEARASLRDTPIEMVTHITLELFTAMVLIVSGFGLLRELRWSRKSFFFGAGLLIYSVVSAAGFYGQQGDIVFVGLFGTIFLIGALIVFLMWVKESPKNKNSI